LSEFKYNEKSIIILSSTMILAKDYLKSANNVLNGLYIRTHKQINMYQ
jgi:hypothetical protein